jgi:hypothetical protein
MKLPLSILFFFCSYALLPPLPQQRRQEMDEAAEPQKGRVAQRQGRREDLADSQAEEILPHVQDPPDRKELKQPLVRARGMHSAARRCSGSEGVFSVLQLSRCRLA